MTMDRRADTNRELLEIVRAWIERTGERPSALILATDVFERSYYHDSKPARERPATWPVYENGVHVRGGALGGLDISSLLPHPKGPHYHYGVSIGRDASLPPGSIVPIERSTARTIAQS